MAGPAAGSVAFCGAERAGLVAYARRSFEEIAIRPPPTIFDRRLLRLRQVRATAIRPPVDYLLRHTAALLAERLGDVRRDFPLALDLGGHALVDAAAPLPAGRIGRLVRLAATAGPEQPGPHDQVVGDVEALPFADGSFDLVLSSGVLHWVNDLPGTLLQVCRALRPDGLFLAALPGGDTLIELREALLAAESEVSGGASLRVSPFVDVRAAGALLQRAGFALPVVDLETLTVTYDHPLRLLADLRAMGQTNALSERAPPLTRPVLARMSELYRSRFADARGRIRATFQFLMLSGWRPHASQPQPKRRGSGRISLRTLDPAGDGRN